MFKALIEKIVAVFAQPRAGVVVPVDEKVEKAMQAPYKIESPAAWPFPTEKPAIDVTAKPAEKKPAKKRTYKKKTQA
jgi:hypothetical protein